MVQGNSCNNSCVFEFQDENCKGPKSWEEFIFHYRPKGKYGNPPEVLNLYVCVCTYHYNQKLKDKTEEELVTYGYDEWDALDYIACTY